MNIDLSVPVALQKYLTTEEHLASDFWNIATDYDEGTSRHTHPNQHVQINSRHAHPNQHVQATSRRTWAHDMPTSRRVEATDYYDRPTGHRAEATDYYHRPTNYYDYRDYRDRYDDEYDGPSDSDSDSYDSSYDDEDDRPRDYYRDRRLVQIVTFSIISIFMCYTGGNSKINIEDVTTNTCI